MKIPGIDREEDRFACEINVTNTKRADSEADHPQSKNGEVVTDKPKTDSTKEGTVLDKCLAALDALNKRMDAWEAERRGEKEEEREADTAGLLPSEKEREEREIKPPEQRSESYESFRNYPPRREYDTEAQFALRNAQARADEVAQLFGERAPPPVTGEPLHEYRMRLLRPWQRYSAYKGANLTKIGDPKAFDAIEAQIYSDAAHASEDPDAPPGQLREIKRPDANGRIISTFHGRGTWIGQMKPASRKVLGFTMKPDLR
jgi:hypothetical protein